MKIVIADDQTPVRQGVRELIEDEPDFEVVGEANCGMGAIEITGKLKPDILVTDLKMPRLDGIGVTKQVRELSPDTRVVILSMYSNKTYMDAAFQAGAPGYVVKKSTASEVVDAIRTAATGQRYLSA